jgi:hypothetical protein
MKTLFQQKLDRRAPGTPRPTAPFALGVLVRNQTEVASYLEAHPELQDFTHALIARTTKEITSPKQIEVEVYHDPEIAHAYLSVTVRQPNYTTALMPQLDRIWEELRQALSPNLCTGMVNLTTDFAAPNCPAGRRLHSGPASGPTGLTD